MSSPRKASPAKHSPAKASPKKSSPAKASPKKGQSTVPFFEGDVAWNPSCPPGHTPFTWTGKPANYAGPIDFLEPVEKEERKSKLVKEESEEKKPEKKAEKKSEKKKAAPAPAAAAIPDIAKVDIRVGKIVSVEKHPDASKLYIEKIDVGEAEPRTIVSGLVDFVPIEEMQGATLLAICNFKPAPLRNVMSYGMVLCAGNDDHTKVELVVPPEGSKPGDRLFLENDDFSAYENAGAEEINPKKKNNAWVAVKDDLTTDADCCACYKGVRLVTKAGPCKAASLALAHLS